MAPVTSGQAERVATATCRHALRLSEQHRERAVQLQLGRDPVRLAPVRAGASDAGRQHPAGDSGSSTRVSPSPCTPTRPQEPQAQEGAGPVLAGQVLRRTQESDNDSF